MYNDHNSGLQLASAEQPCSAYFDFYGTPYWGLMKPNSAMVLAEWLEEKLFHGPVIISKEYSEHGKKYKTTFINYLYLSQYTGFQNSND